jgi:hypothetical protein
MKMSLNFKFLYYYFTSLFFEFSGSGVSINANNNVLNFYINKVGSRLLNKFSSLVMQTPTFLTKLSDESIIFIIDVGKIYLCPTIPDTESWPQLTFH